MSQPALIVFAKQPVPGAVKTRLQPEYTAAQAAEIATVLIRATVDLVTQHWSGPIYLAAAPDIDHPLFRELREQYRLTLTEQGDGDLGVRMQRALMSAIARHGSAAVIGCDVPHCPPENIRTACASLAGGESVIGPADDGGYYLLGLQRAAPELFEGIAWGGASVYADTLERARRLVIGFTQLPTVCDIDSAEDLRAAAEHCAALRTWINP